MTLMPNWNSGATSVDIGDSRTVTVAVGGATVDVTYYFVSSNTSTNDTATAKYYDRINRAITKFNIRPSADVQIKAANGLDYTDPIPIGAADSWTNSNSTPLISLTISVPTDGTVLDVFVQ